MPKYCLKEEDFQALLLFKTMLKEEIKYLLMLEQLKCMEFKENFYSDYKNLLSMELTISTLILVLI